MVKRNQYAGKKARNNPAGGGRLVINAEKPVYVLKEPVEYGDMFIVMEDAEKNTFSYNGSAWVAHTMSIAECKQECMVKALPQKVGGKIRYEVRAPLVKR